VQWWRFKLVAKFKLLRLINRVLGRGDFWAGECPRCCGPMRDNDSYRSCLKCNYSDPWK
jgi:hypothetical protein